MTSLLGFELAREKLAAFFEQRERGRARERARGRERGRVRVEEITIREEDVHFNLPKELKVLQLQA